MWKDSETKIDYLDFEYLKEILKDIINDKNLTPSTIGVYGDWGSGKSSLIGMVMEDFETEKGTVCIKFNGWLFEGYEDAKTSFMGCILDEISLKLGNKIKIKQMLEKLYKNIDLLKVASLAIKHGIAYSLTGGAGNIALLLTEQAKKEVSNISDEDIKKYLDKTFENKELRVNIVEFRTKFEELLKEAKIEKVIIFIDELDRCNSNTILETFEAMRLFLFTKNTSFIIGADERHIEYAVKQKFKEIEGNHINIGKEYLEKIIQYPIKIPQLGNREMENYIAYLFLQNELNDDEFIEIKEILDKEKKENTLEFSINYHLFEDLKFVNKIAESLFLAGVLGNILANGLNGNPRHCKRFLNTLVMREKMAKFKKIKLQRKVLAKLMILEYFHFMHFKKLPQLIDEATGKISELIFLEESEDLNKEKLKKLQEISEDKEFTKWVRLEPPLSNVDIRPYLYFSRDTLNKFGNENSRLGRLGNEILESLINKSQIQIKKVTPKIKDLNLSEADYIYNIIENRLIDESSRLDSDFLKIICNFCVIRNEKIENLIKYFEKSPINTVTISSVAIISSFFCDTKRQEDELKLFEKWDNNINLNPRVKQALKKRLTEK